VHHAAGGGRDACAKSAAVAAVAAGGMHGLYQSRRVRTGNSGRGGRWDPRWAAEGQHKVWLLLRVVVLIMILIHWHILLTSPSKKSGWLLLVDLVGVIG